MSGTPAPLVDALLYLIIPAPEHHARVIPKSSNMFPHLNPHAFQEFLSWWVKCVAKHKVMPEHNAHGIGEVIKGVQLVMPASPHSEHVEIRVHS